MPEEKKHLLLVTQVYLPDPASVGQHMADTAEEMARRGWEVTVLTSGNGYDDPSQKFPAREQMNGVDVIRLPFSSFGKKTIAHRLAGQSLFCLQAILRGLLLKRLDSILVTTSPPIGGMVGWLISVLRGVPFNFWVMDLNPDQAIAQGIVSETSLPAKIFNWLNRRLLNRSTAVIAMDRFIAKNLEKKVSPLDDKMHIIAPWPMEDALEIIPKEKNPFLEKHGLTGKFVLMYSGNHSPVHPLSTFLKAAQELKDDERIIFAFVGGGKAKEEVNHFIEKEGPPNVISLPYQPLDQIKYSLSAADIHLVSMGEPMIGCVHPCKFYGAMSLAKPVLYLGPKGSHIGEVIEEAKMGWQIDHGETELLVQTIRDAAAMATPELQAIGDQGRAKILSSLSREHLCGEFCEVISTTSSSGR